MTRGQALFLVLFAAFDIIFVGGLAVFALAQNGAPAPTRVPPTSVSVADASTGTPVPRTATRVLEPDTPAPPTATLVIQPVKSPTPSAAAMAITASLDKFESVASYRMEMDVSAKGNLGDLSGSGSPDQQVSLITMNGEVSGSDSHMTLKGFVAALLTGDPAKGYEQIQVAGKSYVHGPLPLLGAKEDRWYVLPGSRTTAPEPSLKPHELYAALFRGEMTMSGLAKSGTETLDRKRCDIYATDEGASIGALLSLNPNLQLTRAELDEIQRNIKNAEFKFWVCEDGYLHQMRLGFESQDRSGQTLSFKLVLHIYDLNAKITIAAPANALPATNPFLIPTPTPKK